MFFELIRLFDSWVVTTIVAGCVGTLLVAVGFLCLQCLLSWHGRRQLHHLRHRHGSEGPPFVVGFFHPYCNAGGGGERVLWTAIRALQTRYPKIRCVVYTGDTEVTPDEILQKAQNNFNITLPRTDRHSLEFVFLYKRCWVEAIRYPAFTLLGQSLGSLVLGMEALWKFVPDLYVDSMGYAFTLPLFRYLGNCRVGCYVHYPTISTDMLQRVSDRTETYNNQGFISRSPVLSYAKLLYYRLFAYIYSKAGRASQSIMVNSSWTRGHILQLWDAPDRTHRVYPPCDTAEFLQLPLDKKTQPKIIVSVAQFRPEKDQPLQIRSFAKFLAGVEAGERRNYQLVLMGSCRNLEDQSRVEKLKQLCETLQVQEHVDFRLNFSFANLKACLAEAYIGLHTMWNEHFGIGVVELMASGNLTLAHNSGGPKLDIVTDYNGQQTGFLADSVDSYAKAFSEIFALSSSERRAIQLAARQSVERFTEDKFENGFVQSLKHLLPNES